MVCRWVRDSNVPGGRYHVPDCYGGAISGPDGCYCDRTPKQKPLDVRVDNLETAIKRLTAQIEKLEESWNSESEK